MRLLRFIAAPMCAALVVSAQTVATPSAPPAAKDSAAQTSIAFVEAFNALDPARFDAFFADDVTMFFPPGPFPSARVNGKKDVTAAFNRFFEMAKEKGATRLNIQPANLQVQNYGDLALASFELGGKGSIGRRSILFRRDQGSWRIVHFHASSVQEPQ
jgi:ketosteroid isomerase-like protein